MTDTPRVRRLGPDDVADWKRIRRAALTFAPRAFGRTLVSHEAQTDADHGARLAATTVFAAYAGQQIIGSAGWHAIDIATETHRGKINSVFVQPEWQGRGVSDALMEAIVTDATDKVLQLELTMTTGFPRSLAFYQRRGFEIVGTVPRALCHDGEFSDEHLMVRRLDA